MTAERCGLGSFIPSGCRGRAEAFARRLQTRLRSLGTDDIDDEQAATSNENAELLDCASWTNASTSEKQDKQPIVSPNSDRFYDFDISEPGSPSNEENCVNPTDGLESGCVLSSPNNNDIDSDTSDVQYYDPAWGEVFADAFSAIVPSQRDSAVTSEHLNDTQSTCSSQNSIVNITNDFQSSNNNKIEAIEMSCKPNSQSSSKVPDYCNQSENLNCSGNTACNNCNFKDDIKSSIGAYSNVKLNAKDGLEYSNTLTCPDDTACNDCNPIDGIVSGIECSCSNVKSVEKEGFEAANNFICPDNIACKNCNLSDDSKSEISCQCSCNKVKLDEKSSFESSLIFSGPYTTSCINCKPSDGNACAITCQCSCNVKLDTNAGSGVLNDSKCSNFDILCTNVSNKVKCKTLGTTEPENIRYFQIDRDVKACIEDLCDEIIKQAELEVSRLQRPNVHSPLVVISQAESIDKSPERDSIIKSKEEINTLFDSLTLREGSDDSAISTPEEDKPRRVQRSSSLKSGKTPPGTPGRKKIVRFADVLGLDLADVRTFMDDIPKIPRSAYYDLETPKADVTPVQQTKTLQPMFIQPVSTPDFITKVRSNKVCLENAFQSDSLSITGTVRVLNIDFHKSVHIRYTLDNWENFADLQATYVQNSSDGFSDTFSFVLYAHTLDIGQRLEFAIRYNSAGQQFWDSNNGKNYVFQCLNCAGSTTQTKLSTDNTSPEEDGWSSFY